MHLERITVDPAAKFGKPRIRGLRVTTAKVPRRLANQRTPEQAPVLHPCLELEYMEACPACAAFRLDDEELVLTEPALA